MSDGKRSCYQCGHPVYRKYVIEVSGHEERLCQVCVVLVMVAGKPIKKWDEE